MCSVIGRAGFIGGIVSRVGFMVGKVKIGVSIVLVLVLAKLFLRRYLIRPKLNSPPVAICSLISNSVHSIGSSSYRVLNSDLGTMAFLYFFTHTPLVHRNVRSFRMLIWLQSLKIYNVKFWKSSL
jgi:hypothetical protein